MVKKVLGVLVIALAAAACQNQQDRTQRDVWSANYNAPFENMVACLAAPPTGAFQVYAPSYPEAGMARIVFIPSNMPQARSAYVVLQMVGGVSMVSWKRFGNVTGGLDWLDGEARKRADACAGM